MNLLAIKEDVWIESSENLCFLDSTHEKSFVHMHSPGSKSAQHSKMA